MWIGAAVASPLPRRGKMQIRDHAACSEVADAVIEAKKWLRSSQASKKVGAPPRPLFPRTASYTGIRAASWHTNTCRAMRLAEVVQVRTPSPCIPQAHDNRAYSRAWDEEPGCTTCCRDKTS